jgi:hypothetical protein
MTGKTKDSAALFLAGLFNIGWYFAAFLLGVAALCVVLVLFVQPVGLKISIPVAFNVEPQTYRVTSPSLGIDDAQVGPDKGLGFELGQTKAPTGFPVAGSLSFPAQRDAFLAANIIILIVSLTVLIWVLGLLGAVVGTIRDGQPFVPANATRLRWIAAAAILGELVRAGVAHVEGRYVVTHFVSAGVHFNAPLHINVLAIINGLIILVIAEAFRVGTRLDEEQSLTV